jgi:hypothetical protein
MDALRENLWIIGLEARRRVSVWSDAQAIGRSMLRMTIKKMALLAVVVAGSLTICSEAEAQTKIGPNAPVTYDNKYEIYGGLNFMNFKAGEDIARRMDFGGGEIEGTYWVTPKWGAAAEFRGEAGTSPVLPNPYMISRPLVYMNMVLFGAQYRWAQNQHAALDLHAYGGPSVGVFTGGTAGGGYGESVSNNTPAKNAQYVGLYNNHTAPVFALGGSIDMNRSKDWAIRLSPDLILEHFGNETRTFFAISGGVVYRFPLKKKQ